MDNCIVWFTNDLRLHDNEALWRATQKSQYLIPVYCFDKRHFADTTLGFKKTGSFRAKFLLESVANLQANFRKLGTELIILHGKPEEEIFEFAKTVQAKAVYGSKEVCAEEVQVEQSLEKKLNSLGIELKLYWQSTLLHTEDLPYPIRNLPDIFTDFRKSCEKIIKVRSTFDTPKKILSLPISFFAEKNQGYFQIPNLADFGMSTANPDRRAVLDFVGGEDAALQRLENYFWVQDKLKVYKETRNGLIGADYSSKFSAWLALGCISPRKIYEEIANYELKRVKNESTYWLFFELLWRDYFRFVAKKYDNKLFILEGLRANQKALNWREDKQDFENWKEGKTGLAFVDANMLELKNTGFMSNRGRQNVASFLTKDLKINWQWGASYFESQLIDYDVCSNWGNWTYMAGVGNDPRENRYFNIAGQAKRYDEKGEYVRLWLI